MTGRTIFVGDIHGCGEEFDELLDEVALTVDDRLLLTGDAFTRGPSPLRVWQRIVDTRAEMVLGNHDDRQLKQLRRHAAGKEPRFKHDQQRTFEALQEVAERLYPWLEARPLFLDEPAFFLCHAGVHPVHGPGGTERDEFLTIRTWPPVKDSIEGPRWHDVIDPDSLGGRPLVFGHDAPGGLTIKRRPPAPRPWLVGLDSGCVYGNQLTAWILEEDRLVQVASRQPGL